MGVDGDRDGRTDIHNDADSVFSAANYLTKSGVSQGAAGVRRALYAYNHVAWYVNDVLYYAHRYGGGTVLGDPDDCGADGDGNPNLPPLTNDRVATVLRWAQRPRRRPLPDGRQRPARLRLLQLHPDRLRPDRHPDAPDRRRATQLAGRRQRHPHPTRPRTTRRPGLLGLLPRPQPHRPRHDRLEPGQQDHHRSPQHPRRHRPLHLRRQAPATTSTKSGASATSTRTHELTDRTHRHAAGPPPAPRRGAADHSSADHSPVERLGRLRAAFGPASLRCARHARRLAGRAASGPGSELSAGFVRAGVGRHRRQRLQPTPGRVVARPRPQPPLYRSPPRQLSA